MSIPQERLIRSAEIPGPRSRALDARRQGALSSGLLPSPAVYVAAAEGAIVVDVDGNRLIDMGSGFAVMSVGHSAPAVVSAITAQAAAFTHTCFVASPYEGYVAVAEALNRLTPVPGPRRSVLFNSGAEAVENAVKVARYVTGRQAVVSFEHAFHGRTSLAMALTANSSPYKHRFGPFAPEIYRMPMSYPFRDGGLTGAEAARRVITRIDREIAPDNLAAIIIEPIQGEGGFVVPAPGFLPALAGYARSVGAVLIADEIQTGFCRTGDWFACEHEGVEPDLITMAKGIAAGMPLSGLTGRAELLDAIHVGGLGGTYAGNPVACAAALAAIQTMEALDLPARARAIEALVRPRLLELAASHPHIGEVRGRGAMLAIELVRPGTTEPDPDLNAGINAFCHSRGVLTLTCGTFGNVMRLLPPLTISDALLDDALSVLGEAFDTLART